MSAHSQRSSSYSKRSSQQSSVSWSAHHMSKQSNIHSEIHSEKLLHSENSTAAHSNIENFSQKVSSSSSSMLMNMVNSSHLTLGTDEVDCRVSDNCIPPAIPQKTKRKQDRQPSPYDNVPENNLGRNFWSVWNCFIRKCKYRRKVKECFISQSFLSRL